MKRGVYGIVAAVVVVALVGAGASASACTTFRMARGGGDVVVGKSYDWSDGGALVVMNPHGVEKRALVLDPRAKAATWTSRYASVTFNQYGRELPNGGMNEAGLVVEIMWLTESEYEPADARPVANELQWIQLQLDRYATTAEVVAHVGDVRIEPVYAAVHWMVCDKGGDCAVVEVLGGELVVTRGERLAAPVLTNDTYARSVAALAAARAAGGGAMAEGSGSLPRFVRAAELVGAPGDDLVAAAWGALDSVRSSATQWNIVYEPGRGRLHFRTRAADAVKTVVVGDLVGGCAAGARVLDIDALGEAGDATRRFAGATREVNRARIAESLGRLGRKGMLKLVDAVAAYPESLTCAAP